MPTSLLPPDQPIYDSSTGQSYDPRYLAALQGTPAWGGFAPTQPASLLQVLQALSQWMGMALPGRGGLGRVAPTMPMQTGLRTPKQTEDLGKLVDQGFRDWMRENVTGKSLPSLETIPVQGGGGSFLQSERDIYERLLSELFAQGMNRLAPRQFSGPFSQPVQALFAALARPQVPIVGPPGL